MLKTIIRREIMDQILSVRFIVFFVLCIVLIPLSIYVNHEGYQARLNSYNKMKRMIEEDFGRASIMDIMQGTVPIKAVRPPSSLSIFASGLEDEIPRYYTIKEITPEPGESKATGEAIFSLFGKLDLLFIVQVILSLAAFLFAFDAIAGEKERGTLAATLSNPLPRDTLLFGKFLGGYITLLIPFGVSLLIGFIILNFISPGLLAGENLSRLSLVILLSFIYIATFFALGMLVSTRTTRANTSLIMLLFLWVVVVLAIPKISVLITKIIKPVKSETVFGLEKSLVWKDIDDEKNKVLSDAYLRIMGDMAYLGYRDRPPGFEEAHAEYEEFRALIHEKYHKKQREAMAKMDKEYERQKDAQRDVAMNLSRISPASSFVFAVTDLCQTGESIRRKFLSLVKSYHRTLEGGLFSKVARDFITLPGGRTSSHWSMKEHVDLKSLTHFSFEQPTLADSLRSTWVDILLLVIFGVLFFISAYVSFLRYDVR